MVDDVVERAIAEVREAVPDDLAPCAVHVRDAQLRVHQEQAGRRVLGDGEREAALVGEVGVKPQLLDRHRGELRERRQDPLVAGIEVALEAVRQLDQAEVAALVADERHAQEPAQWRACSRGAANRVGPALELGVRQAERPVRQADLRGRSRPGRLAPLHRAPRVAGVVRDGDLLGSIAVDGEAGGRLVGADDLRGARGRLEQHLVDGPGGHDREGRREQAIRPIR